MQSWVILSAALVAIVLLLVSRVEAFQGTNIEPMVMAVQRQLTRRANAPAGTKFVVRVLRLKRPGMVRVALRVKRPNTKLRRAWYKEYALPHEATQALVNALTALQPGLRVMHLQVDQTSKKGFRTVQ